MDMITQGIIAAVTIMWLFSFIYMFAGSYAGTMTGVIAGLIVSITLRLGRSAFGCVKPRFIRRSGDIFPSMVWVRSK